MSKTITSYIGKLSQSPCLQWISKQWNWELRFNNCMNLKFAHYCTFLCLIAQMFILLVLHTVSVLHTVISLHCSSLFVYCILYLFCKPRIISILVKLIAQYVVSSFVHEFIHYLYANKTMCLINVLLVPFVCLLFSFLKYCVFLFLS